MTTLDYLKKIDKVNKQSKINVKIQKVDVQKNTQNEQEGPDIFFIKSENVSTGKERTIETPVGSGIDIINNQGVITLNNKDKQKTEIVNCGCY